MARSWKDVLLGRYPKAHDAKAAMLPYAGMWQQSSWLEPTWNRLVTDGYNNSGVVGACVGSLAFKFPEPPLEVRRQDGEPIPTHPLQALLTRPNPIMGHAELMQYIITYLAVGGNCYLHKVRNGRGVPLQVWPYHAGHILPVPDRKKWVSEYEYDLGDGRKQRIPAADIIHLKWPLIDLHQPWLGMPPLRQVAREVDADGEMTRMIYSLLRNDAVPWTIINVKQEMSDAAFQRLQTQFAMRHGGDNKGKPGILEGEATINRMALNLKELDVTALRRVPEGRIAAAFRVPPIFAGLNVGLEKSTYANFEEARKQFTEDALMPLWSIVAGKIEQDLAPEFGGNIAVAFNTAEVSALQENEDALYTRMIAAFDKQVLTKNEVRRKLGYDDVPDGDTFGAMPQPSIIDVTPRQRQLTAAAYPYPATLKKLQRDATADIEADIERDVAELLERHYARLVEGE